eukprot:4922001-Amphidinium_carterae.1
MWEILFKKTYIGPSLDSLPDLRRSLSNELSKGGELKAMSINYILRSANTCRRLPDQATLSGSESIDSARAPNNIISKFTRRPDVFNWCALKLDVL